MLQQRMLHDAMARKMRVIVAKKYLQPNFQSCRIGIGAYWKWRSIKEKGTSANRSRIGGNPPGSLAAAILSLIRRPLTLIPDILSAKQRGDANHFWYDSALTST